MSDQTQVAAVTPPDAVELPVTLFPSAKTPETGIQLHIQIMGAEEDECLFVGRTYDLQIIVGLTNERLKFFRTEEPLIALFTASCDGGEEVTIEPQRAFIRYDPRGSCAQGATLRLTARGAGFVRVSVEVLCNNRYMARPEINMPVVERSEAVAGRRA